MIYRIRNQGRGYAVEVEDDEGVILASAETATMTEAKALQRKARFEGYDVLASPAKPKRKGK